MGWLFDNRINKFYELVIFMGEWADYLPIEKQILGTCNFHGAIGWP
jgi:hypothetical protein